MHRRATAALSALLPILVVLGLPGEVRSQEEARLPDTVPGTSGPEPVDMDTVTTSLFDQGKMWTFEHPPLEYLRERYGFEADSSWFRKARLGALRLPNCSASFVSPRGLVMTNHHCARDAVAEISRDDEELVAGGFYAGELGEERRAESLHADQLVEILDVTDRVRAELAEEADAAVRSERRDTVTARLADSIARARGGEEAGVVVEVVSLYQGALYSAYVFRRYEDVRVVLAPELLVGKFGGDPDNFTYPRYSLDMSFLRIYGDDGEPLETETWFPWSPDGVEPGELVFVVGNPGTTRRLETVAQLELRRDVTDQAELAFMDGRVDAYLRYLEENPGVDSREVFRNALLAAQNEQKRLGGVLEGLRDPYLMARKRAFERQMLDSIRARPELEEAYGSLVDSIAALQEEKRALGRFYAPFLGITSEEFTAAVLHRSLWAFQWLILGQRGAPEEQLRELRESTLAVGTQPPDLQELLLAERFRLIADGFGPDHQLTRQVLQGRSPEGAAARLVQGSILADSARTAAALESGNLPVSDPGIQLLNALIQPLVSFQQAFFPILELEEDLVSRLGRARFEIWGTDIPPDATFSLRLADGVVEGYRYNGTLAPPVTTYYGLWDHLHSYRGTPEAEEWALPEAWLDPPRELDLSTPLNSVSTADIIGGNSGSPLLDRDLRVVGLVFDGNMESLPGDFIYLPERNRAVSVDARGILEALDVMYDADRLVLELTTGELVESESAADARRDR